MMKRNTRTICWLLTVVMLIGLMPFAAFAGGGNSVIETVNLTDFVIPSVGDQAVNDPSCTIESGKGYTYSSSMFFYNNNQFTRTFQGAETYTVRFHLAAEEGYEFAPMGTLTATVNGGAVTVKSVSVGAMYRGCDSATVEAEFTMPDLREEVSEFVGTSNMGIIAYGDDVKTSYDFSFTVGTQAYITETMGHWEKWNETNLVWERYNEVKFTEGKYRYYNQLRIDGNNGKTHKLAATGTVTIDGAAWEYDDESIWIEPTYSYTYITSPEFTVEKAAIPLDFTDNNLYNIGINYIDTAITSYSVSGGVMGGTEPYVFSKTSGPEWVNVAADGTVSGTPTALGENIELVIRVTDADSNYEEITVSVDNTYCKPEDRITVSVFEATSNMPAIAFGTEVKDFYDFDFTVGTQAYITETMGYWEKWNESLSAWEEYEEDIFTLGKYRYSNQLRIDNVNGKTHKLAETATVTIDGAAWEYDEDAWIEPTYSYTYITSPEFEVGLPEVVNQIELNNVIIPAAGDSASTAPTCTIEGKADLSVAKYFYGNVAFNSVFESCKTYTIRFNLIAEAGYEFETAENLSVTVNGGTVAVKKMSVGAKYRKNDSATVEIEFNFHSPAFVPGQKETCTTDGWKDYYDCICGKHFEDAAATTEIVDLDAWKIGAGKIAAGHKYGTLIAAKPEVHTKTELKGAVAAHYFCDECDTYFDSNKTATTLAALTGKAPTHSGGTATCKAKAKCATCGVEYGAINADNHSFGAYVYNGDATGAKDGTKTRTCSACKKTETITAAGTKRTNPFTDVKASDYFYDPVLWAVEKEVTTGTDATHFAPEAGCTRGQVVTFLWRAAGKPKPQQSTNPFVDVPANMYYYEAVLWAVEKGITTGTDATHFDPEATCTRGQIVTFLWRYAGKPAAVGTTPFTDVGTDFYYCDAVRWAVGKDITKGVAATLFGPESTCTRGQIVTFLYRLMK